MRWEFTGAQKQKPNTSGFNLSRQVLALSWNIATDPKLYRELASNPYSPRSLRIISERFPGINVADVIMAVVWAEPEGRYDRGFRLLETKLQEKELRKQSDNFVEINKRLVQFSGKYAKQFRQLPKELVYNDLSFVVFGTTDLAEIKQRFAQNQRRDLKLSIVNLIEDIQGFKHYRRQEHPYRTELLLKAVFAFLSAILLFYSANSLYGLLQVEQRQTEGKDQILAAEAQKENQVFPTRLIIPSINIDAAIEHVGITRKGEMEVPSNSVDVGWFKLGPVPGDRGSAVMDGHVDGENNGVGVFANLYKLKKGDKLYIEDNTGAITFFVVRGSRIYDPGYSDDVFSRSDGTYLNLITCDGVWDGVKKNYSKRLVVFTDIIP